MGDNRVAFEWGMASVAIGSTFALAAIAAFPAMEYVPKIYMYFDVAGVSNDWAAYGWFGVIAVALAALFAGVVCAVRSISAARTLRQPAALGIAGLVLNAAAWSEWSYLAVCWYFVSIRGL